MTQERDTYKYHLKVGKKVVYRGITSDLSRRLKEHATRYPNSHIEKIGNKTTRDSALKWERKGAKR